MGKSWKSRKSGRRKGQQFLGDDRKTRRLKDVELGDLKRRGNPLPLDKFKVELLKVLGDSHEAREMTDRDLKDLYESYLESGKTFKVWSDGFLEAHDEVHA